MDERRLDHDFLEYRSSGSPEALGRVFDAAAPRLLLIAAYLTSDAAQAEDLVQTTFLHAMRDAAAYDGARPVVAWLAGILQHRASDLRRRVRLRAIESLDASSLAIGPGTAVEDREVWERVVAAADALPAPYREVLVLRLVHGLTPTAIAHTLGRAPGTVRMQLQRAAERLRRALPACSFLGAAWWDAGGSLAAVRQAVLARASASATSTAAAIATATSAALAPPRLLTTASLFGITTLKALSIVASVLTGAVALFAWRALDAPQAQPAAAPIVASGSERMASARDTDAVALEIPSSSRAPAAAAPGTPSANEPVHASLTVQLTFASDGSPAAHCGVYVRSLQPGALGRELRTDAGGRACFEELTPGAHRVLIDRDLEPHELIVSAGSELAIAIPAGVTVHGRVLDLAGNSVAGARILRFHESHHDLLQTAAISDAAGRFVLRDVAPEAELLARASGFQPSELTRVNAGEGDATELELVLGARGNRLRGRVLHADGSPAASAWVALAVDEDARESLGGSQRVPDAGRHKSLDRETFYVRADERGEFASDEVPAGDVLIVARSNDAGAEEIGWERLWIRAHTEHEVTLQLQRGAELRGVVRDTNARACAGLTLQAQWEGTHDIGQLEDDLGPRIGNRSTTTAADGSFRFGGLLAGEYDVDVLGERVILLRDGLTIEAGASQWWEPTIDARARLRLRLLDPQGTPLAGWAVAASAEKGRIARERLPKERSDAHGRITLTDLTQGAAVQLSFFAPQASNRYAIPIATREGIEPAAALGEEEELEIRLDADELVVAHAGGVWRDVSGAAIAHAALELELEGWSERAQAHTDEEGRFRFECLPRGRYRLFAGDFRYASDAPLIEIELAAGEVRDIGVIASVRATR